MGQMPEAMQIVVDACNDSIDSEGRNYSQRAIEDAWTWAVEAGLTKGHLRVTIYHNKRTGKLSHEPWMAPRMTDAYVHGEDCGCKRGEVCLVTQLSPITDPKAQLAGCVKRRVAAQKRAGGARVVRKRPVRKAKAAA